MRETLGLDGIVVVVNRTTTVKDATIFAGAQMLFYGRNPVPLPDSNMKANKLASFEGYEGVVEAMATASIDRLDKAVQKSK